MWDGSNNYQESLTPCTVNDDIDEAVTDDSRCSNNQQLNMVKDTVKLRDEVLHGLDEIFACKRGSRGKYKKEFRSLLKEFGITLEDLLLFSPKMEEKNLRKNDICLDQHSKSLFTTRPLSRCTAEQLGLYYRIFAASRRVITPEQ